MFSFNFLVTIKQIFAACLHLYMEFKFYCIFIYKYHRTANVALNIEQWSISVLEFKFQLSIELLVDTFNKFTAC